MFSETPARVMAVPLLLVFRRLGFLVLLVVALVHLRDWSGGAFLRGYATPWARWPLPWRRRGRWSGWLRRWAASAASGAVPVGPGAVWRP